MFLQLVFLRTLQCLYALHLHCSISQTNDSGADGVAELSSLLACWQHAVKGWLDCTCVCLCTVSIE